MREDVENRSKQIETFPSESVLNEKKLKKRYTSSCQRKQSLNVVEEPKKETHYESTCSVNELCKSDAEKLTVAKMEHFSRLSMLQKLQAIFAVSKLS